MKQRLLGIALSVAAVLAFATAATAGTVTITFNDATVGYGGFGVGLYQGTVNGGPAITNFICDDFEHEIGSGDFWTATVGSTNPVSSTVRFEPPSAISNPALTGQNLTQQEDYNMITYLAEQIFADPTDSNGNWGYLSWAIWSINSDAWNSSYSSYYTTQVQTFVTDALNHKDTNNGNLIVYTPTGDVGQEFLADAPEPASVVLFGTILALAMAGLAGKKLLS